MFTAQKSLSLLAIALLLVNVVPPARSQDNSQPQQPQYRMRVTSELVLVNVVVRDKKGNLVRGLKKEDFTLSEDGKKQDISTFDFENVDELATAGAAEATVTGEAGPEASGGVLRPAQNSQQPLDARGRSVLSSYQNWLSFASFRLQLPRPRYHRVAPILKNYPGYARHARGLRSAAKDLLRSQPQPPYAPS